MFAARQLQEKCQEQNTDLFLIHVDLTNPFDMVSRRPLGNGKIRLLQKFITIIRQFHDVMHAKVQDKGESSIAFPITNEVKQAPTLFSIMFSVLLFDAFSGLDNGIDIRYRTDSSVFK